MNCPPFQRGIALIEALMAAVLLAMGAAALARLHSHLSWAADEVRHQGEALWLALQALEQAHDNLRVASGTWSGTSARFDYQGATMDASPGGSTLTTHEAFPLRSAQVTVTWIDRKGQPQSVALPTLLSTADPALTAWLTRADR